MPRAVARDPIYRGHRFPTETIELCVRWYVTYRLSYRDLSAMVAERGIAVSHTTILRWVLKYLPEYERRWARIRAPGQFVVENGRNGGIGARRSALPLPGRGPAWEVGRSPRASPSANPACVPPLPVATTT
jgi:hypothetical protein